MNKVQHNTLKMLKSIEAHLSKHTLLFTNITALQSALNELQLNIQTIDRHLRLAAENITGIALDKSQKRNGLQQLCKNISNALVAYYTIQQNSEAINSVYLSASKIKQFKDAELVGVCFNLHQLANNDIAYLAPFNITSAALSQFLQTIHTFNNCINAPKEARLLGKHSNSNATELLVATKNLVKNVIDNLVALVNDPSDKFILLYKTMRQVQAPSMRTRSLVTICLNAITKQAVPQVQLSFSNSNKVFLSGKMGKNYFQNLAPGNYTISAYKEGFAPYTNSFEIVANTTYHLQIMLHT
jgi:hypothetical protein